MFEKLRSIAQLAIAMLSPSHSGEKITSRMRSFAVQAVGLMMGELLLLKGCYHAECVRADGSIRWSGPGPNTVVTVEKNFLLDTVLAGSAYTAAWYMGLMSSVSYTAISCGRHDGLAHGLDRGRRHECADLLAGRASDLRLELRERWLEVAVGPHWRSRSRRPARSRAPSSRRSPRRMARRARCSAPALFTGGDKAVANTDTVNVSYTLSV